MRVVMLGPFGLRPKGTMLRRALPAARALAARGADVTVLMPPWHTPEAAGRRWTDPVSGVGLAYDSLRGLSVPLLGHGWVASRMARRALTMRPDVVHVFKPKAYSGLAGTLLWLRQRLGARFALVVDSDDWEGPGGWNTLEPYSALERRTFAWQERWGLTHADAVTVASRALETLTWALGVPPATVHYLPNAIDDAAGLPRLADSGPSGSAAPDSGTSDGGASDSGTADQDAVDRAPTLLLYTRFFEYALARPLDVLARVRQRQPRARLVVAGTGLFGEETRFAALAAERGLADAVELRGWVEPDALPALLAAADVALYPFDDTLVNRTKSPVKLLELMAAGLPVVAEAVGEPREVIVDGQSGRLVPPGDADAFAAAVSALLDDGARHDALGRGARARVEADYVWSRRVVDLRAAYRQARTVAGAADGP